MARPAMLTCAGLLLSLPLCCADEPLHRQIDRLIAGRSEGRPAKRSSDAEFFRRIHLDLAGCIPTADETRQFLSDTSPDKRRAVIDRLLNAASYADRMANLFDVMLMERRGDNDEWRTFLRHCFVQNMPWDRMVHKILSPDRENESLRGFHCKTGGIEYDERCGGG